MTQKKKYFGILNVFTKTRELLCIFNHLMDTHEQNLYFQNSENCKRVLSLLEGVRDELQLLQTSVIKAKKPCPNNYRDLIDQLYKNRNELKTVHEFKNYRRVNFYVSKVRFLNLLDSINTNPKIFCEDRFLVCRLQTYLTDLNDLIEGTIEENFLEYTKNYNIHSIELHKATHDLAFQFSLTSDYNPWKQASWVSILALRKSMEIKFRRMLGFYKCIDLENQREISISNECFRNFIKENIDNFKFSDTQFSIFSGIVSHSDYFESLIKIYTWTNYIVHGNLQPYIWQVEQAIETHRLLFQGGEHKNSDGKIISSTYGSVKIKNYELLKEKLEQEIREQKKKEISIDWIHPEAICIK